MTANEIRKKFLDFFASKGHTIIASDSVVPKDDPTVLFTTAGMQQFKRQFLGQNVTYKRAASSQKCLRTDDLDKVGKTAFHHTFFEMLGNFSFGDYFKKDAIAWAWEFLTDKKWMGISSEKLWVSVYEEDDETYNIWLKGIKVPKERIVKLGDKSNFWPSEAKTKGPNGPCGPCSEIFYDYGVNKDCPKGNKCDPDCNCGRFSEVWNLVFTQFNRKDGGVLEPLPGKNIDTGMGFERLVAVVQGKKNNFDTDIFAPITAEIEKVVYYSSNRPDFTDYKKRVVADHMRAIVFAIADGVIPSNEGRGYVVRRLIIDSADLLQEGVKAPLIYKFVSAVIAVMGNKYPEISIKEKEISELIKNIEEAYIRVQVKRMPELRTRLMDIKQSLPDQKQAEAIGALMFEYRDTHGLTIPVIFSSVEAIGFPPQIITDANLIFTKLMENQQLRSRASSKMTGDVFADADLNLNVPKTEFVGYADLKSSGKILKIFIGNNDVAEAKKCDSVKIILDKTPFYAESGGQIGDTGTITKNGATIRINDTKKIADIFIHMGEVTEGNLNTGDAINTQIDEARRLSIMRNHTATHLLQAALRNVLGSHVQQQGSLVAEEKLRFDFTHPQAVTKDQLSKIEDLINKFIAARDKIEKQAMPIQEAKKSGALAFFAEKYGDTVRVITINGYSKEFCGGTHLNNTEEIKSLRITGEGAIAQGIRRIEAVTGDYVQGWMKSKQAEEKSRQESERSRQLEQEQKDLNFETIKGSVDSIIKESKNIGSVNVIRHRFNNVAPDLLRKISDLIKQKVKSAVIALACEHNGTANVLIVVTDDLIKKDIRANELIQEVASAMNASGGGRPQLAQAGGKDPSRLDAAFQKLEELVKEKA